MDLASPVVLGNLLLAAALAENPDGIVLVHSQQPHRIRRFVAVASDAVWRRRGAIFGGLVALLLDATTKQGSGVGSRNRVQSFRRYGLQRPLGDRHFLTPCSTKRWLSGGLGGAIPTTRNPVTGRAVTGLRLGLMRRNAAPSQKRLSASPYISLNAVSSASRPVCALPRHWRPRATTAAERSVHPHR